MDDVCLQTVLYDIFINSKTNLFDSFINECQKWYESPAHSLTEMRVRENKKLRGDIFEDFCVMYLKYVLGHDNVWLLKDVPDAVLEKLTLKRRDMGIDIIIQNGDKYQAVQCKYKKHVSRKKNVLSWKVLSTFYALCLRSGPWEKFIVMTNCEYVLHQGKKTAQDVSICLKRFQNITRDNWLKMCGQESRSITDTSDDSSDTTSTQTQTTSSIPRPRPPTKPRPEELRSLRVAYYNSLIPTQQTVADGPV